MPSELYVQIIIDAAFFIVILLLLHQLNKRMAKKPADDVATVGELGRLMRESQASADLFLRTVQESEERLGKLARQLDGREKRIIILIEKAESLIRQLVSQQAGTEPACAGGEKYGQILRLVQQGLSREEAALRLGISIGEIDLVVDLERARQEVNRQGLPVQGGPSMETTRE